MTIVTHDDNYGIVHAKFHQTDSKNERDIIVCFCLYIYLYIFILNHNIILIVYGSYGTEKLFMIRYDTTTVP